MKQKKIYPNGTPYSDEQWKNWYTHKSNKELTIEPIMFTETWHKGEDGFYIQRLTAQESGKVINRKTPFKEIPWSVTRWFSQEEVDNLREELLSSEGSIEE